MKQAATCMIKKIVKNLLENRLFSFTLQRDFRSLKYFQETEIPSYSSPGKHWKVAQEKIPEKNLPLFSMNRRLTIERPDHKFNTYLSEQEHSGNPQNRVVKIYVYKSMHWISFCEMIWYFWLEIFKAVSSSRPWKFFFTPEEIFESLSWVPARLWKFFQKKSMKVSVESSLCPALKVLSEKGLLTTCHPLRLASPARECFQT